MSLTTTTTTSGFLLPSIHSAHPFFTHQPNPATLAEVTKHWSQLILTYARFRRLFVLRVEDAEESDSMWAEILRNDRINRKLPASYLSYILETMVNNKTAVYEPAKQTRSVILYWRLPEEWAEVLHDWVRILGPFQTAYLFSWKATSTGQLNTILTFYDITDPPVPSPLSDIPIPLLRTAITVLSKANRAQIIGVADGEGVRLFSRT